MSCKPMTPETRSVLDKMFRHLFLDEGPKVKDGREMSYYTRYELQADDCEKHEKEIEILAGYSGLFDSELKWYKHEKNMREHSLKYPDLLFRLHGEGEHSADIWIEYYKNGKMQKTVAKLVFDKFREELLK